MGNKIVGAILMAVVVIGLLMSVRSPAWGSTVDIKVVSETCMAEVPVAYTIVEQRDGGVDIRELAGAVMEIQGEPGDDPDALKMAKYFALQIVKDAYSHPKLDKKAVAARAYKNCMGFFGLKPTEVL